MSLTTLFGPEKSRHRELLDHFAEIEDPRQQSSKLMAWRSTFTSGVSWSEGQVEGVFNHG